MKVNSGTIYNGNQWNRCTVCEGHVPRGTATQLPKTGGEREFDRLASAMKPSYNTKFRPLKKHLLNPVVVGLQ